MTAGTAAVTSETTREPNQSAARPSARAMVNMLLSAGYRRIEASNLAGLAVGLGPVASGWSILEIERLRFLQHLDTSGHLPG